MKRTIATLAAALALAVSVSASTNITFHPADSTYTTNISAPWLSGPLADLFTAATTATNWMVGTYGIYSSKDLWGAGVAGVYNFNSYIGTAIRLDASPRVLSGTIT